MSELFEASGKYRSEAIGIIRPFETLINESQNDLIYYSKQRLKKGD